MAQPIIRGIQAVGAVDIKYGYNGNGGKLTLPPEVMKLGDQASTEIDTTGGVNVAGFRLDSEFLRAVQQIASSVQIPILGGGAVALTNNNRSGTLSINCTKTSTPTTTDGEKVGSMHKGANLGPKGDVTVYLICTGVTHASAGPISKPRLRKPSWRAFVMVKSFLRSSSPSLLRMISSLLRPPSTRAIGSDFA